MAVNIDTDWRGQNFSEKLQTCIEERTNGEAWPSKFLSSDISTIKRWRQASAFSAGRLAHDQA